jgi:NADPH:quinone reductase-like Zn-dependent oxidoreductase
MGHGGLDQMVLHKDWRCPQPSENDVLIRVSACGLNNTDVNTRSGWYSKAVTESITGSITGGTTDGAVEMVSDDDSAWGRNPITFPRIQGADICGRIVAVGSNIDAGRIGERIITDNWLRDPNDLLNKDKAGYLGSERDGGFAEYTAIPASNALAIQSNLTDAELATFSCSYSTAEGMLTRAKVKAGDTVLVPGASGGVGGALIQLAKLRGARVIGMASEPKHADVLALGADLVLPREPASLQTALADEAVSVVADIVGGNIWPDLIEILQRGGRYTCSGAIAGPMVNFDLRTFYLRDLTFTGSTVIDPEIMLNLVGYIEASTIKPVLAARYSLDDLKQAQAAFIAKKHTGNIVVCP